MQLLITGGAGFVGSNLARGALERGHQVRVIDNLTTGYRENLDGLDVEFIEGSVTERARMDQAIAGVDSVVHLAALGSVPRSIQNPIATHQANVDGTLSVLESARSHGVDHVIFSSSSSVYGMNPTMPKSEREWVRPMSPYAVSKLAAEQYVLAYANSFGMKTLAFRFFNVYGPGQRAGHVYAAVIPVFVDALLHGKPMIVNGDGSNSRDFTFVGSVCEVLLQAVERQVAHSEPVNLAFGTNTTLLDLMSAISKGVGVDAQIEHAPPRPGDVQHSQAENSSLRRLFPDVSPIPLAEGLRDTITWFKEKG